ncbi:MAG: DegT/DnrJ/EryC1/StrS family aminotransferase, partial [Bacteroidales bacterium]|nr:DegT/DnrJ/EryC1/StrS family aminotransferase [Bacteroidales bacterium]
QAHGAAIYERRVGSVADVGAFSFYPTKNLGALGDGGAITTSSDKYADTLGLLRQYGWRSRYSSEIKGVNSRLDELQAAILLTKLRILDDNTSRRREIARRYNEAFKDLPLTLPVEEPGFVHVYHQYVIQTKCREMLAEHLKEQGVGTAVLYPTPIHKQPAYLASYGRVQLPVTELLAQRILSLPVYPELSDMEVEWVIKSVREMF